VSSYTNAQGETREMADVWFAKAPDTPPVGLDDVLAAPSTEVLPGVPAAAPAGGAAPAATGAAPAAAGSIDRSLLADEDLRNPPPLI
jgi:hypothetical protein